MNFENLKARKTKYVVIGIVIVALIVLISTIFMVISLSGHASTNDDFSSSQIDMSESITTESTTTTSNTESSSTTVTTTSTSETSSSTSTSSSSTTTAFSTASSVVTTKKNTETTTEVQTTHITTTPLVTEPTTVTVETKAQATEQVEVTLKTNEEIAQEVIHGLWGNGNIRRQRLTEAGYDYNAVQAIVNNLMRETTTSKVAETTTTASAETTSTEASTESTATETSSETTTETEPQETQATEQVEVTLKTNEEIVQEVIHGLWGNGADRKQRLTEAGYDYSAVQAIVDELMKSVVPTPVTNDPVSSSISYVKNFSRGTYYAYGGPRKGGSGRQLIDCSYGDGTVKGSIASSYLYRNYGYNYNGKRTMVYLEISGYPSMNGYYYLDDSDAGNPNVIDFFYLYNSNCQFQYQGVVSVDCYIVAY